jgi:flagellar basal body-associated protein FliL
MLFIILAIVAVMALAVGAYFMFFSGKSPTNVENEVSDGGSSGDEGSSSGDEGSSSGDGGSSEGSSGDDDEYTSLSLGE